MCKKKCEFNYFNIKGKAHSLCIDQSGILFTWGAGKLIISLLIQYIYLNK
jgi:hypothetical protein